MKIDRQLRYRASAIVKPGFTRRALVLMVVSITVLTLAATSQTAIAQGNPSARQAQKTNPSGKNVAAQATVGTQDPATPRSNEQASALSKTENHRRAVQLIDQVIDRLANGRAFDCKLRQRVRTAGREVVGVGTYLQSGSGTGQFSFQIQMHDGDGKHSLEQISDGRLAWTRSEIAGTDSEPSTVALSRVDVGWLDEGARSLKRDERVKPSMKVGGPSEMLDTIRRDYDLKLGTSSLGGRKLVVLIGNLKDEQRQKVTNMIGELPWPEHYPTRVNIAVALENDPKTGFGKGLPIRIEHLSDPIASAATDSGTGQAVLKNRQMISLLEFYSIRPISPPPIEKFRFENQDAAVDFVNETGRYEERFDIRVSAKERAKYR